MKASKEIKNWINRLRKKYAKKNVVIPSMYFDCLWYDIEFNKSKKNYKRHQNKKKTWRIRWVYIYSVFIINGKRYAEERIKDISMNLPTLKVPTYEQISLWLVPKSSKIMIYQLVFASIVFGIILLVCCSLSFICLSDLQLLLSLYHLQ